MALGLALPLKAQDPFTNGLVAHYPFAGNANDVWGGLHGVLVGNITPAPDRFGADGMACNFDGASFVNIPDNPAIQLQAMTICLWVQLDNTNGIVDLVNKDDWGQGFQLYTSGNQYLFSIGDGGWHTKRGSGTLNPQQWHHLAATYDSQTLRLFLDGTNTDSADYPTTLAYSTNPLQIGRNGALGNQYLYGNLSNLRLYGRALSPDEVQQLYSYEATRLPQITLLASANTVTLSFSRLTVGTNYQLQLSGDLNTWTNHGAAFPATDASMVYSQSFNVDKTQQLFFRLSQPAEGRASN